MRNEPDLITVGRVSKPHGIRGELKVVTLGISPDRLVALSQVCLMSDQKALWYDVKKIRRQPAGLIFDLSGVVDRNQAEKLRNFEVQARKEDIPTPVGDQFDPVDLEGFVVETVDGDRVGILKEVMQSASQDIFVIDDDGKEVLIPAVEPFISDINMVEERIVIEPIDGLLNINES